MGFPPANAPSTHRWLPQWNRAPAAGIQVRCHRERTGQRTRAPSVRPAPRALRHPSSLRRGSRCRGARPTAHLAELVPGRTGVPRGSRSKLLQRGNSWNSPRVVPGLCARLSWRSPPGHTQPSTSISQPRFHPVCGPQPTSFSAVALTPPLIRFGRSETQREPLFLMITKIGGHS